jgi:hypothetical protein
MITLSLISFDYALASNIVSRLQYQAILKGCLVAATLRLRTSLELQRHKSLSTARFNVDLQILAIFSWRFPIRVSVRTLR